MLLLMSLASISAVSQTTTTNYNDSILIEAIISVESGGNPRAYNKHNDCVGILQITPILVKDCNQILARKGLKKRYTLKDRYNIEKSKEMFLLYQETYNPQKDLERAIRIWNGGPTYNAKSTEKYYKKVIEKYKTIQNKGTSEEPAPFNIFQVLMTPCICDILK